MNSLPYEDRIKRQQKPAGVLPVNKTNDAACDPAGKESMAARLALPAPKAYKWSRTHYNKRTVLCGTTGALTEKPYE